MRLFKKGLFFLFEQSKKVRIFHSKIVMLQIIAKFLPFLKIFPDFFVEKICLKSQNQIIEFIKKDKNLDIEIDRENFKFKNNIPRIIWVMWLQGMEEAPFIIKKCINSIEKFGRSNDIQVNIITSDNIHEYITVPKVIEEKFINKQINGANYSDYCRCALLAKYGGIWVDSTVFIKDKSKFDVNSILTSQFFSVKNENPERAINSIARHRWNTCLLAAPSNSILFVYVEQFLVKYYSRYDLAIDYLLIDYAMHMAYLKYESVRKNIDSLPMNNINLLWLDQHASESFNTDTWSDVSKSTAFFKLSRKSKYNFSSDSMISVVIGGD